MELSPSPRGNTKAARTIAAGSFLFWYIVVEEFVMVNVKQAISNAVAYAAEVLGISDLLLEEVRSEPDHFEITLSFPTRGREPFSNPLAGVRLTREYKKFDVNKDTGEVTGMSIRQIAVG
jgi:hypothetical protein